MPKAIESMTHKIASSMLHPSHESKRFHMMFYS
jgi:hypothetical protein